MYLYTGYIECGQGAAAYEFEHDEKLDGMEQLTFLLETGMLQIIDHTPERI